MSDLSSPAPPAEAAAVLADSRALAERLGVGLYDLEVVEAAPLSPAIRRIRLRADGLGSMSYQPGQDLMISVARLEGRVVRRRYTIRELDRTAGTVTIDVVLHGDGPGARWAGRAASGDRLEAIGPRGKVVVDPGADWHLFVGDESFTPAAWAMSASVEPSRATSILEAAPEDIAGSDWPTDGDVRWVTRPASRPVADGTGLLAALDAWSPPIGRGHVYVGGEARVVGALRQSLLARGLDGDRLSAKAYWRAGAANADHGEPQHN